MVNLDSDTKETFDELQPEELTQDDFVSELLQVYEMHNADDYVYIDNEKIVEKIVSKVGPNVQMFAHSGTKNALEEHFEE